MNRQARLAVVLVLNLVLMAGLAAVGLSAHSIGVLAEGVDYLADAAAIAVSLIAIRLARRKTTTARPAGYPNATLYAAMVNSGWLLVLSMLVVVVGIDRLATGTDPVQGLPVLIASGIAAVIMLVGALILSGDLGNLDDDDPGGALNMRAVLLDTAADAAAAGGVAAAGAIIAVTGGLYWLDPAVAIAVSAVVAWHAIRLLRQAASQLNTRS